jgi:hypothetical protein
MGAVSFFEYRHGGSWDLHWSPSSRAGLQAKEVDVCVTVVSSTSNVGYYRNGSW